MIYNNFINLSFFINLEVLVDNKGTVIYIQNAQSTFVLAL